MGLLLAAVALGSTLTACGADADNATCGEVKDMSADEFFDFLKDAAEEEDTDEARDLAKQFDDIPDDQREATRDAFVQEFCDGEDDDTKLKDTDFSTS